MKLYAPISYWEADEYELVDVCNGCGSKDGIKVPNTFYGLNISRACDIHDWMYHVGKTKGDKLFADAMFLLNMALIVINNSGFLLGTLRLSRASKYFIAVLKYGKDAYWVNKPYNETMTITHKGEFR